MQDTKINKSIGYNYAIAKSLYDSPNGKIIINEVDKLLDYLIELILAYNNNPTGSLEKLNLIKQIFRFKTIIHQLKFLDYEKIITNYDCGKFNVLPNTS